MIEFYQFDQIQYYYINSINVISEYDFLLR